MTTLLELIEEADKIRETCSETATILAKKLSPVLRPATEDNCPTNAGPRVYADMCPAAIQLKDLADNLYHLHVQLSALVDTAQV